MNLKWADKITNEELWKTTQQKPIEIQIKRRNWNLIGHKLRKEVGAIEKTALCYACSAGRFRIRLRFRESGPVGAKNVLCLTVQVRIVVAGSGG